MSAMGMSDWLAGWMTEDDVETGKRLDEQIAAQDRSALDRGIWTQDQYDASRARKEEQSSATYQNQVKDAFKQGWQEGEQTVSDTIGGITDSLTGTAGSIVSAPLRGLLKGIPWWLWIAAGVAALAYLGLLPSVAGAARRAFKR